jgi:peroxiredoxin
MKKYLKITLSLLFLGSISFMILNIVTKINHNKQRAKIIKTIPTFTFEKLNGKLFTKNDIIANQATLFVYYNSQCDFCNEEAKMIKQNITKFSNIQLLFISSENKVAIEVFAKKHQLNNYNNITFLIDSKMSFRAIFDVKILPCLVLYNKNQQLIEKIKGQIKTDVLLKKLDN